MDMMDQTFFDVLLVETESVINYNSPSASSGSGESKLVPDFDLLEIFKSKENREKALRDGPCTEKVFTWKLNVIDQWISDKATKIWPVVSDDNPCSAQSQLMELSSFNNEIIAFREIEFEPLKIAFGMYGINQERLYEIEKRLKKLNDSSDWWEAFYLSRLSTKPLAAEQPFDFPCSDASLVDQITHNDLILRCIFSYLEVESLRNCRLVSTRWEYATRRLFKKRACVTIKEANLLADSNVMKIRDRPHFDISHFYFQRPLLFKSFKFEGTLSKSCISNLSRVRKDDFEEIILSKLNLESGYGHAVKKYNISPMIGKNLTRLDIVGGNRTRLTVPLSKIESIECLTLIGCTIIIDGKICPRELTLKDVKYLAKGAHSAHIRNVLVNEFVNFNGMKRLTLDSSKEKNMALDIKEKASLEFLYLGNVNVDNWEKCNWAVDNFLLHGIFFDMRKMKIKQLELNSLSFKYSELPATLEKLWLVKAKWNIDEGSVSHPNLKQLDSRGFDLDILSGYSKVYNSSALFNLFPNIVNLQIMSLEYNQQLHVGCLPNGVRNLYLNNVDAVGTKIHPLERLCLVVYGSYADAIERSLAILPPKHFVLKTNSAFDGSGIVENILLWFNDIESLQTVLVGPVLWDGYVNKHYLFTSNNIDREARYYLFQKGTGKEIIGKSIDENVFTKEICMP